MSEQEQRKQDFHELRREKKLTQRAIAQASGVKSPLISEWERGNVLDPRYSAIESVAAAMGIDTRRLYETIKESYYRAHPDERPLDPPDGAIAA